MIIRDLAKYGRNFVLSEIVKRRYRPAPGTLTVLTYHRILADSEASAEFVEPGMYVNPQTFEAHLRTIREQFTPVRLRDWPDCASEPGNHEKRFMALTFDDGWIDNYSHAFQYLKKYSIPATVFLVTDAIEQKLLFWSDKVAAMYRNPEYRRFIAAAESVWRQRLGMTAEFFDITPDPERLAELVAASKQLSDSEIHSELEKVERQAGQAIDLRTAAQRRFMNWDEIDAMADSGLVDFGSHSQSHSRLDTVQDEAQIMREVVESRRLLKEKLGGGFCDIFCYPNGNVSGSAEDLVRQNYSAACTVSRGSNDSHQDPYLLKRIGVHQDSSRTSRDFLSNVIRS